MGMMVLRPSNRLSICVSQLGPVGDSPIPRDDIHVLLIIWINIRPETLLPCIRQCSLHIGLVGRFVHCPILLDRVSTLTSGIDPSFTCSWLCTGWFLPKMHIPNDTSKPEYTQIIFIKNTLKKK